MRHQVLTRVLRLLLLCEQAPRTLRDLAAELGDEKGRHLRTLYRDVSALVAEGYLMAEGENPARFRVGPAWLRQRPLYAHAERVHQVAESIRGLATELDTIAASMGWRAQQWERSRPEESPFAPGTARDRVFRFLAAVDGAVHYRLVARVCEIPASTANTALGHLVMVGLAGRPEAGRYEVPPGIDRVLRLPARGTMAHAVLDVCADGAIHEITEIARRLRAWDGRAVKKTVQRLYEQGWLDRLRHRHYRRTENEDA
jgi:DNA-binding IclR family transcriptional regulator